MYADDSQDGWLQSTEFKKAQCIDVDIDFMGVWDTVSSVGWLRGKELPFTKNNTSVKVFRHALSLDERRAKFPQNHWRWARPEDEALGVKPDEMIKAGEGVQTFPDTEQEGRRRIEFGRWGMRATALIRDSEELGPEEETIEAARARPFRNTGVNENDMEGNANMDNDTQRQTDVQELWFAGCHSGTRSVQQTGSSP